MNISQRATVSIPTTAHGGGGPHKDEPHPTAGASGPLDWLDRYTRPRPTTDGDLHQSSYIQPMFHAVPAGFAFMGLRGIASAAVASVAATFVDRKTHSRALAFAAGAATGGLTAAALASLTGRRDCRRLLAGRRAILPRRSGSLGT